MFDWKFAENQNTSVNQCRLENFRRIAPGKVFKSDLEGLFKQRVPAMGEVIKNLLQAHDLILVDHVYNKVKTEIFMVALVALDAVGTEEHVVG